VLPALAEGLDSRRVTERPRMSIRAQHNHVASVLAGSACTRKSAVTFAVRYGPVEIR
jgi:hypothetical protein